MRGINMIFGYMRISTQKASQTTDRQKDTLKKYSIDNNFEFDEIIEERISGTIKADNRPEYSKLKEKLRKGDILVITDLDRLGNDYAEDNKMVKTKYGYLKQEKELTNYIEQNNEEELE